MPFHAISQPNSSESRKSRSEQLLKMFGCLELQWRCHLTFLFTPFARSEKKSFLKSTARSSLPRLVPFSYLGWLRDTATTFRQCSENRQACHYSAEEENKSVCRGNFELSFRLISCRSKCYHRASGARAVAQCKAPVRCEAGKIQSLNSTQHLWSFRNFARQDSRHPVQEALPRATEFQTQK